MSVTSGHTSATPLAYYDPDSCCWKTSQATFLSEDQPSLPTLPASGMTHDGWLYALPTSAPAIAAPDGSALPTPEASDGGGGRRSKDPHATHRPSGAKIGLGLQILMDRLLPTPVANDDHKQPAAHIAAKNRDGTNRSAITSLEVMSRQAADTGEWTNRLLPTPTTDDANNVTRESGSFTYLSRTIWEMHGANIASPSDATKQH